MNQYPDTNQANLYDNLMIDIERLYRDFPLTKAPDAGCNKTPGLDDFAHRIYRCPVIPLKYRSLACRALRQIRLDQGWFLEFRKYWSSVLNARPLWGLDDLYFLKNIYRIKFQNTEIPDVDNAQTHRQAWQRPEVLYQLLHLVCREAIIDQLKILKKLSSLRSDFKSLKMLEFGCGTAPITASLYDFFRPKNSAKIYISDIPTLAFHYACYRFRHCSNIVPALLRPEDRFALNIDDRLDVIFCITVFEHLNDPIRTIKTFHKLLKPDGLLFFDYIKSDGKGLDTQQAVEQRDSVIDFLGENFDTLRGSVGKDKDIHLTIVRKR